jgi:hypothetical protein
LFWYFLYDIHALQILQAIQFSVKREKCQFDQKEAGYLGHLISYHGVAMDPGEYLP